MARNRRGRVQPRRRFFYYATAPCDECQSPDHQLVDHPNPNTPEGYLKGCLPCNKVDHSLHNCPRIQPSRRPRKYYTFYVLGRRGKCPGELMIDFRIILKLFFDSDEDDEQTAYTPGIKPLSPECALSNPYSAAENQDGHPHMLKTDPLFKSAATFNNLGFYVYPGIRCSEEMKEQLRAEQKALITAFVNHLQSLRAAGAAEAPTQAQIDGISIYSPSSLDDPRALFNDERNDVVMSQDDPDLMEEDLLDPSSEHDPPAGELLARHSRFTSRQHGSPSQLNALQSHNTVQRGSTGEVSSGQLSRNVRQQSLQHILRRQERLVRNDRQVHQTSAISVASNPIQRREYSAEAGQSHNAMGPDPRFITPQIALPVFRQPSPTPSEQHRQDVNVSRDSGDGHTGREKKLAKLTGVRTMSNQKRLLELETRHISRGRFDTPAPNQRPTGSSRRAEPYPRRSGNASNTYQGEAVEAPRRAENYTTLASLYRVPEPFGLAPLDLRGENPSSDITPFARRYPIRAVHRARNDKMAGARKADTNREVHSGEMADDRSKVIKAKKARERNIIQTEELNVPDGPNMRRWRNSQGAQDFLEYEARNPGSIKMVDDVHRYQRDLARDKDKEETAIQTATDAGSSTDAS